VRSDLIDESNPINKVMTPAYLQKQACKSCDDDTTTTKVTLQKSLGIKEIMLGYQIYVNS